MTEVTVKLRWKGRALYVGAYLLGDVLEPMPMSKASALALGIAQARQDCWIGVVAANATGYHTTEAKAKAAVEAAVVEALEGDLK